MPLISVQVRIISWETCGTTPRELNARRDGVSISFRPRIENKPDRGPYSSDAAQAKVNTAGLAKLCSTPDVDWEAIRALTGMFAGLERWPEKTCSLKVHGHLVVAEYFKPGSMD